LEQERASAGITRSADSRWLTIFLFLTGALASTILLKIGPIQYLEIIYFTELLVLLRILSANGFKFRWFRPYRNIALWYLIFALAAFALSVCALRYDFYFPDNVGILNRPILITISRIAELFASVSIMLYLAGKFREDHSKAAFTMRVYFWVGVASAVYSILSLPFNFAGIDVLGAYGSSHRMRGFYNEGGPYGLYLISVFLVGMSLYKQKWIKKNALRFAFVILSVVFLGSQSNAAFCAVIVILVVNGFLAASFARRMAVLASVAIFLVAVYQVIDLGAAIRAYQRGSQAYEWLSHRHAKDPSFIAGRVAGAFLVPKMVAAHPLVGVGWGNYGLVRNAPEYRGAAAFTDLNDDPGLGLLGMSGELGLPLVFVLGICLFLPFLYLRRIRAPLYLTNLALLQPFVHLFGAQLNLTYPWIATSFALGLGYSLATVSKSKGPGGTLELKPSVGGD